MAGLHRDPGENNRNLEQATVKKFLASDLGKRVSEQLQNYEVEVQRTRNVCARFHELGLLDPMRFDLTATDGRSFAVDGFMAINEEKYRALPDDKVLELHRNGLLALLHAHMISMRNMQRLGQWKMERLDKPAANG